MSSKCSDLRQHIFIVSYFLGVRNSAWLSWVSLAPGLRRLQSRCWLGLQSFQGSTGLDIQYSSLIWLVMMLTVGWELI